ncbi:MAG: radical SAM protein [Bacteroidales bacterium]|nr:radical SAM protein [Bacteroidales bacterium]HOL98387.1 radical SAM protein [Bacteroidales bacterium]HOM37280.1 radical SAM protein [Bacteroidales bacterium]HPD24841.1 radical SAM protein [Bacteroidales bacterium]HRS99557.1 radical SAM protein [Bacteroidales bacterium]
MLDSYKRNISYLRISVTDRCNLRCVYCMPPEGVKLLSHDDILSFDEIVEVVKTAVSFGITKVRITGGEPLVRKGIVELVKQIAEIEEVNDLAITTNGILLKKFAADLKNAGLMRINVSLDTLDPFEYSQITRGGNINDVFQGLEAAKNSGFDPIKINAVVFDPNDLEKKNKLKEFANNNGYQIRFISQMNLRSGNFSVVEGGSGGDCASCNRLRLTADGFIKPCLFSDIAFSVRNLGAEKAILSAISNKPEKGIVCFNNNFYNIGG